MSEGERLDVLGEIALEVAHELRNLLLIIDSSNYLAQKDPSASGVHLDKIERAVRSARAIVDDVFSLSREEPLPREETTLPEVISIARTELDSEAADFVDRFEHVALRVHDRLLARIFKVLYENAIQMRSPDRVRIETRAVREGGVWVIDVEDDGPGVDPAIAERVFEPLVSSRRGGTGMGLPLARRIAQAHGANLDLVGDRSPTRKGACFRLRLPADG